MDLKLYALLLGKINAAIGTRPSPIATVSIAYASEITVAPNTETNISTLTGDIQISLGAPIAGVSNEWDFVISQGDTAYDVVLPEIVWGLGIAPTFSENTSTMCRLYYVGDTLCGEWVAV